jgi:cytochrome c oxidase cbb3-type subunit III
MSRVRPRSHFSLALAGVFAVLALGGCNNLPGRPAPGPEVVRPDEILDFRVLYQQGCAGCHGADGKGGASIALRDPVYLAIADDNVIRSVTAKGVRGTQMPPFAQSAGGMLTDKQLDVLVRGIRSWAQLDFLHGVNPPPYTAQSAGDPHRGAEVFATFCSGCHGSNGTGTAKASSIVDGSYLALVSDQGLRTIVIAGRSDLGAPDWRNDVSGRPMSAQEISDVVAWLAAQRRQFPGQPYSNSENAQALGALR